MNSNIDESTNAKTSYFLTERVIFVFDKHNFDKNTVTFVLSLIFVWTEDEMTTETTRWNLFLN